MYPADACGLLLLQSGCMLIQCHHYCHTHSCPEYAVHAMQTDPTRFLSGSDDGTVRLWSIADESAVACIDSKANVCSVQFSPTDSNLMAFGSANYRVYLYDLRQVRFPPWGHAFCLKSLCVCTCNLLLVHSFQILPETLCISWYSLPLSKVMSDSFVLLGSSI